MNNIKRIEKIINLLDKHIFNLLSKNDVDVDSLDSLTDIRISFIKELNNLISSQNKRDLFDKKYFEIYRKNKW